MKTYNFQFSTESCIPRLYSWSIKTNLSIAAYFHLPAHVASSPIILVCMIFENGIISFSKKPTTFLDWCIGCFEKPCLVVNLQFMDLTDYVPLKKKLYTHPKCIIDKPLINFILMRLKIYSQKIPTVLRFKANHKKQSWSIVCLTTQPIDYSRHYHVSVNLTFFTTIRIHCLW